MHMNLEELEVRSNQYIVFCVHCYPLTVLLVLLACLFVLGRFLFLFVGLYLQDLSI